VTDILFAAAELWWEEVMANRCRPEPSLDELFGDDALRLLMRRDGVTESDIRALLGTLKDARAEALGATKRGSTAIKCGTHMPDRKETIVSSRTAKSSEAGKNALRFI
jgi:hypothetical protein